VFADAELGSHPSPNAPAESHARAIDELQLFNLKAQTAIISLIPYVDSDWLMLLMSV
jgi:hypothetical protein